MEPDEVQGWTMKRDGVHPTRYTFSGSYDNALMTEMTKSGKPSKKKARHRVMLATEEEVDVARSTIVGEKFADKDSLVSALKSALKPLRPQQLEAQRDAHKLMHSYTMKGVMSGLEEGQRLYNQQHNQHQLSESWAAALKEDGFVVVHGGLDLVSVRKMDDIRERLLFAFPRSSEEFTGAGRPKRCRGAARTTMERGLAVKGRQSHRQMYMVNDETPDAVKADIKRLARDAKGSSYDRKSDDYVLDEKKQLTEEERRVTASLRREVGVLVGASPVKVQLSFMGMCAQPDSTGPPLQQDGHFDTTKMHLAFLIPLGERNVKGPRFAKVDPPHLNISNEKRHALLCNQVQSSMKPDFEWHQYFDITRGDIVIFRTDKIHSAPPHHNQHHRYTLYGSIDGGGPKTERPTNKH